MYWKENHIKCDIATGKGKKIRDQRQDINKRDWERDLGRILKNAKNNSHPSKNIKLYCIIHGPWGRTGFDISTGLRSACQDCGNSCKTYYKKFSCK